MTRFGGEFGHAAAPTPFAVFYNPAALGGTKKFHLAADLSLALHSAEFKRTETTVPEPADATGANTGTAEMFDVIAGPTLAGSFKLKDFAAGFGIFAPMSGSERWKGNDAFKGNETYPGPQDGAARWHMIEGYARNVYLSSAASYTIPAIRLSLGAGLNLVYSAVSAARASTASLDDNLVNEGRVLIDASGWVWSFSLGAMVEVLPRRFWIGASYQAPPGLYDGMELDGKFSQNLGGVPSTDKATLHQTLADVLRFALRWHEPRWELRVFGDYARWSLFESQCATQRGAPCKGGGANIFHEDVHRWKDAFSARVGGSYYMSEQWELFAGLGYDGNAIPAAYLEPSIIDGHDLSATLGARVKLGSNVALALSYAHIHMLPRDTTGKSRLDQLPAAELQRMPTAGGEYRQWVGMFNSFVEMYFN